MNFIKANFYAAMPEVGDVSRPQLQLVLHQLLVYYGSLQTL